MRERRDPGALWLWKLGLLVDKSTDKPSTATLDSQMRVQDGVLRVENACLRHFLHISLHVLVAIAGLHVMLEGPHEKLCRQLARTLVLSTR